MGMGLSTGLLTAQITTRQTCLIQVVIMMVTMPGYLMLPVPHLFTVKQAT